jgi:hypothetical protein
MSEINLYTFHKHQRRHRASFFFIQYQLYKEKNLKLKKMVSLVLIAINPIEEF